MYRNNSFKLFPLLYLVLLLTISCTYNADLKQNKITESDNHNLNDELTKLNIPELDFSKCEISYKYIAEKRTPMPSYLYSIYIVDLNGSYFDSLVDFFDNNNILLHDKLSESIMFRFKLGDGPEFNIHAMQPGSKPDKIEVSLLNDSEQWIKRMNTYYFFRDLTIYKDSNKTRRKQREGVLVLFDIDSKRLVFYYDKIKY